MAFLAQPQLQALQGALVGAENLALGPPSSTPSSGPRLSSRLRPTRSVCCELCTPVITTDHTADRQSRKQRTKGFRAASVCPGSRGGAAWGAQTSGAG